MTPARPPTDVGRTRVSLALAVFGGLLLPLAFSPFFLWPLALVSPTLLYAACRDGGVRACAARGMAYGIASFGLGVSWIHESFQFSNIALPFAIVLTVGFVAFLSLYPATVCALFARLCSEPRRRAVLGALAFAGLYVLGEWVRGWFLSGFTWLQLGYAHVDSPLSDLLAIVGIYGTGLLAAAWACAVLATWRASWLRRVAVVLPGLALILGLALVPPLRFTHSTGAVQRVAVIQGNVPQDQKWRADMRGPTLERYLGLTRKHLEAQLVVWPETAIPGMRHRMGAFLDLVRQEAMATGTSVLVGIPERDPQSGAAYNSVELLGRSQGLYRKQHLVPFGEYLPLQRLLRPITRALKIPVSDFSPGPVDQSNLNVGGVPFATFICYEIAFGAEVVKRLPHAQLLVTVSNDAWFGDSLGPQQHLQIARARAIETGRYLVRATNTGLSAVVDPHGKLIASLPAFQVADGAAEVAPMIGATPYVRVGNAPALAVCFVPLAFVVFSARGARAAT